MHEQPHLLHTKITQDIHERSTCSAKEHTISNEDSRAESTTSPVTPSHRRWLAGVFSSNPRSELLHVGRRAEQIPSYPNSGCQLEDAPGL